MPEDYSPDIATEILYLTEQLTADPYAGAMHLAVCIAGLAPDRKSAIELVTNVFDMQETKH